MARLPIPGSDSGSWGQILNDYLAQAHQADGSLKPGVVSATAIQDNSISQGKLATTGAPTSGQVLTSNGTSLTWSTPSGSGSVPDADSGTKGLVRLAGDLGGTADTPTVPGLAGKANTVHTHVITDVTNLQTALDGKASTTDPRFTDQRVPTDGSVSAAKIAADAVTEPKLSATNTPTNGQILSFNGTNFTWVNAPSGGGDPVMGGDLSGNASSASIVAGAVGATELATNAVTTIKITDANVTGAKIADNTITEPKLAVSNSPASDQVLSWDGSALTWVTPAAGGAPTYANIPAGSTITVAKSAGTWPARPTSRNDVVVQWKGPDPSPSIVSSGTGGMLDNVDIRFVTP